MRIITENTAKYAGGSYLKQRFYDQIKPKTKNQTVEKQSGTEIAKNIIGGLTGTKAVTKK